MKTKCPTNSEIIKFQEIVKEKIFNSNLTLPNTYLFKNFLRILKHAGLRITLLNANEREYLGVSHSYFRQDSKTFPDNVYSISSLTISPIDALYIIYLYFKQVWNGLNNDKNENKYYIYSVVCIGWLNSTAIKRCSPRKVVIHGYAFVIEIYLTSYLLSITSGTELIYKEYSSYPDHDLQIICNHYISSNQFTHPYILNNQNLYRAERYSTDQLLISPKEEMSTDTIGVYYTGFYARRDHNFLEHSVLQKCIKAEESLNQKIALLAKSRPEYNFILFPHYARNVENYQDAKHHYAPLTQLSNIKLMPPKTNLKSKIEHIDLGIVMNSGMFWDRLRLGKKTVFINPVIVTDFLSRTSLYNVTLQPASSIIEFIDFFCQLGFSEYLTLITPQELDVIHD